MLLLSVIVFSVLFASLEGLVSHKSLTKALKVTKLYDSKQTVQDLDLEQMFEVFEKADSKVSDKEVAILSFKPSEQVGKSSPLGFFDPLGLAPTDSDSYKMYVEAETKHGRLSMLAMIGIVVGEKTSIFFDGKINGPAIYQFQQADALLPTFWLAVLSVVAVIESYTIITLWQPLEEAKGFAHLKKDVVAGNLGFDPLKFAPIGSKQFDSMKTKELNNGRLAMLGVAGVVAQELVTGVSVF